MHTIERNNGNGWEYFRTFDPATTGVHSLLQIFHRYALNRSGSWRLTIAEQHSTHSDFRNIVGENDGS